MAPKEESRTWDMTKSKRILSSSKKRGIYLKRGYMIKRQPSIRPTMDPNPRTSRTSINRMIRSSWPSTVRWMQTLASSQAWKRTNIFRRTSTLTTSTTVARQTYSAHRKRSMSCSGSRVKCFRAASWSSLSRLTKAIRPSQHPRQIRRSWPLIEHREGRKEARVRSVATASLMKILNRSCYFQTRTTSLDRLLTWDPMQRHQSKVKPTVPQSDPYAQWGP